MSLPSRLNDLPKGPAGVGEQPVGNATAPVRGSTVPPAKSSTPGAEGHSAGAYIGQWVRWGDVEDAIDDALQEAHDRSSEGVASKGIRESVMNQLDGYTPFEAAEIERQESADA